MQRYRFFAPPDSISNKLFSLKDKDSIYKANKVLRLKIREQISIIVGDGNEYICLVAVINPSEISGTVLEKVELKKTKFDLTLIQSLPKGNKLSDIIRSCTEVGVSKFLLCDSKFSEIRANQFSEKKKEHLIAVAQEAARQSERGSVPEIEGPMIFDKVLAIEADIKILLHSREFSPNININILRERIELSFKNNKNRTTVAALIGPEGGFDEEELNKAIRSGFEVVTLDLPILRTETAGVVVSGILLY